MKLPQLNLDELNAVGTDEPVFREPAAPGSIWHSTMPDERDIIEEVVDRMKPVILDFPDHASMISRRMRFYRCKRQLLANGNRYMERISFTIDGNSLTIKITPGLEQYRRRDAGTV